MLDDLRDQAAASPFFKEDEPIQEKKSDPVPPKKGIDQITGMSAKQRAIIALLLFMVVGLLGSMVLLVAGKFALPL